MLRLAGIILPLLYFIMPKSKLLILIGIILLFFISQDIARALKKNYLKALYKKSDKKLSNLSLFLLSCLITIILFKKEYAILALSMMIVGDMVAEIVGIKFGKRILIYKKSLEGTLACFIGSLFIGVLLISSLNLNIYVIIIAALVSALVELISGWLDNLTMAPAIALVLKYISKNFNVF